MRALFGDDHRAVRDASYALVAEVFRAASDVERIVLVLALESTGHVFFDRLARTVEAAGYTDRLRYFSAHHLQVEHAHALFEAKMQACLDARALSPDERDRALALVDRVYDAFDLMFDALATTLAVGVRPAPTAHASLPA